MTRTDSEKVTEAKLILEQAAVVATALVFSGDVEEFEMHKAQTLDAVVRILWDEEEPPQIDA